MTQDTIDIAIRLGSALTAGSLIGLERSIHGRPAGFRTHALVCLASALLMLVTAYQWEWLGVTAANEESFRTDPTRLAQGIMTGIGFLGTARRVARRVLVMPARESVFTNWKSAC